jgi:hypothetical protein
MALAAKSLSIRGHIKAVRKSVNAPVPMQTRRIGMTDDSEKLVGDWKLASFFTEDVATKERTNMYGENPTGYLIVTPGRRFVGLVTADGQKSARTPEEQAAAYRTMLAYTGKLRLDGEKFIVEVDAAWNKDWVGTQQVRFWRLEDNKLLITTAPFPNANVPGSTVIGTLVWEMEQ